LHKKSIFYNIWSFRIHKNIIARAAGTFCTFINSDEEKEFIWVKIPSGITKLFYSLTFVTLGQNSNKIRKYFVTGKAGDNVKIGFRPSVRGVAMNPVDHPHGGRTKTNSPEKTPWAKIAKKNK
jgi:large subunit ribosomal protein L2